MPDKWTEVTVAVQATVRGGLSNKTHALVTKEISTAMGDVTFVRLTKGEEWLTHCAGGKGTSSGSLTRVAVLRELRQKLADATSDKQLPATPAKDAAHAPAVADHAPGIAEPAPAVAEADPMDMLDDLDANKPAKRKRAVQRYRHLRPRDKCVNVTMPELERNNHPECMREREVLLLPSATNGLWMAIEHVPWLVSWVASELATGGVPLAIGDPTKDKLEPNCDVPGVHIRWDFDGGWEAIGVSGYFKGKRTKCVVSKMTAEKWEVVSTIHRYKVTMANATKKQMEQAAWDYLEVALNERLAAHAVVEVD